MNGTFRYSLTGKHLQAVYNISIHVYTLCLSDLGVLSNLIGSLSRTIAFQFTAFKALNMVLYRGFFDKVLIIKS